MLGASNRPLACRLAAGLYCPCLEGPRAVSRERMAERARALRLGLRTAVAGRYETYEDFAVVLSPALEEVALPAAASVSLPGVGAWSDLSYLAPNCLYPSQKMQALGNERFHSSRTYMGEGSSLTGGQS